MGDSNIIPGNHGNRDAELVLATKKANAVILAAVALLMVAMCLMSILNLDYLRHCSGVVVAVSDSGTYNIVGACAPDGDNKIVVGGPIDVGDSGVATSSLEGVFLSVETNGVFTAAARLQTNSRVAPPVEGMDVVVYAIESKSMLYTIFHNGSGTSFEWMHKQIKR